MAQSRESQKAMFAKFNDRIFFRSPNQKKLIEARVIEENPVGDPAKKELTVRTVDRFPQKDLRIKKIQIMKNIGKDDSDAGIATFLLALPLDKLSAEAIESKVKKEFPDHRNLDLSLHQIAKNGTLGRVQDKFDDHDFANIRAFEQKWKATDSFKKVDRELIGV